MQVTAQPIAKIVGLRPVKVIMHPIDTFFWKVRKFWKIKPKHQTKMTSTLGYINRLKKFNQYKGYKFIAIGVLAQGAISQSNINKVKKLAYSMIRKLYPVIISDYRLVRKGYFEGDFKISMLPETLFDAYDAYQTASTIQGALVAAGTVIPGLGNIAGGIAGEVFKWGSAIGAGLKSLLAQRGYLIFFRLCSETSEDNSYKEKTTSITQTLYSLIPYFSCGWWSPSYVITNKEVNYGTCN